MKKTTLKLLVLLSTISAILISCDDSKPIDYNSILGGKYELRKFNVKTTTTSTASGCYFLIVGGFSASSHTFSTVRFYFKNNKDEYQLMEKRLGEVNIKIDSLVTTPYVKFYWREYVRNQAEASAVYGDVTKVVIYCKESDFQPEININDLK